LILLFLGCKLSFESASSYVKSFQQLSSYPGVSLGKLINISPQDAEKCYFASAKVQIWTADTGLQDVSYINAKYVRGEGLYISWLDQHYISKIAGKLYRLSVKCPMRTENDCVLFKGNGKESAPPTTTAVTTTSTTTTTTTTISNTSLIPHTSKAAAITPQKGSSGALSAILGVTLFILFMVLCTVLFYVWFRRRYGHDKPIGAWLQERLNRKQKKSKDSNEYDNDNIYEDIGGMKYQLPTIQNFPKRPTEQSSYSQNVSDNDDLYLAPQNSYNPKAIQPVTDTTQPVQDDFYDAVAEDSTQPVQDDFYDVVAEEATYDIAEENSYSKSTKRSLPNINIVEPTLYDEVYNPDEELPASPFQEVNYNCLDNATQKSDDYCTLNSKQLPQSSLYTNTPLHGGSAETTPFGTYNSQSNLYFETEQNA